jgi:hypothetical protein
MPYPQAPLTLLSSPSPSTLDARFNNRLKPLATTTLRHNRHDSLLLYLAARIVKCLLCVFLL